MGSLSPSEVAVEGPFSHEFVHTRGVRLHAATAGDPTDPLILLLHDHTGGWFDYIHSISPLAAAGFHVAALDMRGFGMSDKPPSGYGIRYAVGDVAGVIQSLGHKRAHIVGCGSGGAVAWTLAANYPEHTLSLTSMCA
ncbi:alpha/beta fold hydrolase, partial [Corynebacterium durum]